MNDRTTTAQALRVGDTRVRNGRVLRLYEIELEGEKWEDLGPLSTKPQGEDQGPSAAPIPTEGPEAAVLWMMHVRGPDDIYPAPDYATALAWCDSLNQRIAQTGSDVLCSAVPALWTGDPDGHAAGLAEAIAGWTFPAIAKGGDV
jgi:hypothetical protein